MLNDLKELCLEVQGHPVNIENLKSIRKSNLKIMVNMAIKEKSFKDLEKQKENHSKVMEIKYERLEMQKYLKSNEIRIKVEEAQEIFKMRSRVSDVKYENL